VKLDGSVARPRALIWFANFRRQSRILVALAILLAMGGGAATWYALAPGSPRASKPAIAVLPFDNLSGHQASGRLADGITEDIITDLARFGDLNVIARDSTLVYKDKAVDVREVGRDLKVGYVLDGSIQRQADQIRITAQLIDADTSANLWSARWDRPAEETFAVQSEIAEEVALALGSVNGLESVNAAETTQGQGTAAG
jgi:TolB-like protein